MTAPFSSLLPLIQGCAQAEVPESVWQHLLTLWVDLLQSGAPNAGEMCLETLPTLLEKQPESFFLRAIVPLAQHINVHTNREGTLAVVRALRKSAHRVSFCALQPHCIALLEIQPCGVCILRHFFSDKFWKQEMIQHLSQEEGLTQMFRACDTYTKPLSNILHLLHGCLSYLRDVPITVTPGPGIFRHIALCSEKFPSGLSLLHLLLSAFKENSEVRRMACEYCFAMTLHQPLGQGLLPSKVLEFWRGDEVYDLFSAQGVYMLLTAKKQQLGRAVNQCIDVLLEETVKAFTDSRIALPETLAEAAHDFSILTMSDEIHRDDLHDGYGARVWEWTDVGGLVYTFSLTDQEYGTISCNFHVTIPQRLIDELFDHPDHPPIRLITSLLSERRRVHLPSGLCVVVVSPQDRQQYEKLYKDRNDVFCIELPYREPRGPCLAKAWARVVGIGLSAGCPVHPSLWRVHYLQFVDDDIVRYLLDTTEISANDAMFLQLRQFYETPQADLISLSPHRTKSWSDNNNRDARDKQNEFTFRHHTVYHSGADRPEQVFLIRSQALMKALFVPEWYMSLDGPTWRHINDLRARVLGKYNYRYKKPYSKTTEYLDCDLWRTVFAEGEDFGLGSQLVCKRLRNVYSKDSDASVAGTVSQPKRSYMFSLTWRELVASRLLFDLEDIDSDLKRQCEERMGAFRDLDRCYCPAKTGCPWGKKTACPCLALGYNCSDSCECTNTRDHSCIN